MSLHLRPFTLDDEQVVIDAAEDFQGTWFNFEVAHYEGQSWAEYLSFLDEVARGENLPEGWVRGLTLAADIDGVLVGRASVRLELNENLRQRGGHIGYAVLPAFRRRRYATEMLRQCLEICKAHGIESALLTCHESNVASRRVIEVNGGVEADPLVLEDGTQIRRYWIAC